MKLYHNKNQGDEYILTLNGDEAVALLDILRAVNPDNGVGYFVDDKEKPVVDEAVRLLGDEMGVDNQTLDPAAAASNHLFAVGQRFIFRNGERAEVIRASKASITFACHSEVGSGDFRVPRKAWNDHKNNAPGAKDLPRSEYAPLPGIVINRRHGDVVMAGDAINGKHPNKYARMTRIEFLQGARNGKHYTPDEAMARCDELRGAK